MEGKLLHELSCSLSAHLGDSDRGDPETQIVLVITAQDADMLGLHLDLGVLRAHTQVKGQLRLTLVVGMSKH